MPLLKELLRAVASQTECGGARTVQISSLPISLMTYDLPITGACRSRGKPADTAPQRFQLRWPHPSACKSRGMLGETAMTFTVQICSRPLPRRRQICQSSRGRQGRHEDKIRMQMMRPTAPQSCMSSCACMLMQCRSAP